MDIIKFLYDNELDNEPESKGERGAFEKVKTHILDTEKEKNERLVKDEIIGEYAYQVKLSGFRSGFNMAMMLCRQMNSET